MRAQRSLTAGDVQLEEGQALGQEDEAEEDACDYINASELQSPAGEAPPCCYIAAQVCHARLCPNCCSPVGGASPGRACASRTLNNMA